MAKSLKYITTNRNPTKALTYQSNRKKKKKKKCAEL